MVHPQNNRQVEYANKVILIGLKKKLDEAKCLWGKLMHKILWLYHINPQSITKETLFSMVYGTNAMFPIEIETPSW